MTDAIKTVKVEVATKQDGTNSVVPNKEITESKQEEIKKTKPQEDQFVSNQESMFFSYFDSVVEWCGDIQDSFSSTVSSITSIFSSSEAIKEETKIPEELAQSMKTSAQKITQTLNKILDQGILDEQASSKVKKAIELIKTNSFKAIPEYLKLIDDKTLVPAFRNEEALFAIQQTNDTIKDTQLALEKFEADIKEKHELSKLKAQKENMEVVVDTTKLAAECLDNKKCTEDVKFAIQSKDTDRIKEEVGEAAEQNVETATDKTALLHKAKKDEKLNEALKNNGTAQEILDDTTKTIEDYNKTIKEAIKQDPELSKEVKEKSLKKLEEIMDSPTEKAKELIELNKDLDNKIAKALSKDGNTEQAASSLELALSNIINIARDDKVAHEIFNASPDAVIDPKKVGLYINRALFENHFLDFDTYDMNHREIANGDYSSILDEHFSFNNFADSDKQSWRDSLSVSYKARDEHDYNKKFMKQHREEVARANREYEKQLEKERLKRSQSTKTEENKKAEAKKEAVKKLGNKLVALAEKHGIKIQADIVDFASLLKALKDTQMPLKDLLAIMGNDINEFLDTFPHLKKDLMLSLQSNEVFARSIKPQNPLAQLQFAS